MATIPWILRLLIPVATFVDVVATASAAKNNNNDNWKGARDRFWKHHRETETLILQDDGVDYHPALRQCLDTHLTTDEWHAIQTTATQNGSRQVGLKLRDDFRGGKVILVLIERAIHPLHAKAVQSLAACVRQLLPHLYEARAFYVELGLEEDDDYGGNNPTHLAPLVGVFFPRIVQEMQATLELAYEAAGWADYSLEKLFHNNLGGMDDVLAPLSEVGFRASEHLTYQDFVEGLDDHTDGPETHYTVNYAFSGPQDYDGGFFYIKYGEGPLYMPEGQAPNEQAFVKPNKFDCIVFLGGPYPHGVTEITRGHREMWSSELWHYPDSPFGSTLWLNRQDSFEEYIRQCNAAAASDSHNNNATAPCPVNMTAVSERVAAERAAREAAETEEEDENDDNNDDGMVALPDMKEAMRDLGLLSSTSDFQHVEWVEFFPAQQEPDFWVMVEPPLQALVPLVWRDSFEMVDDGGALLVQWCGSSRDMDRNQAWDTRWIHDSGLIKAARALLYEELRVWGTRQITLDDGSDFTAQRMGPIKENDLVALMPSVETMHKLAQEIQQQPQLAVCNGAPTGETLLEQISHQLLLMTKTNNSSPLFKVAIHDLQVWCFSQSDGSDSLHDVLPMPQTREMEEEDSWRFLIKLETGITDSDDDYEAQKPQVSHIQIGQADMEDDRFANWGSLAWRPHLGVLLHQSTFFAPPNVDYRDQEELELLLSVALTPVPVARSLPENTLFAYGPWQSGVTEQNNDAESLSENHAAGACANDVSVGS